MPAHNRDVCQPSAMDDSLVYQLNPISNPKLLNNTVFLIASQITGNSDISPHK